MIAFNYRCPWGHKAGVYSVGDNWFLAVLAGSRHDVERLSAPPQVHCPHCGASCIVQRQPEQIRKAA